MSSSLENGKKKIKMKGGSEEHTQRLLGTAEKFGQ